MERKHIQLSPRERAELKQFCKKGVHNVRLVNRAKIILALDTSEGRKADTQMTIAERVGASRQMVNDAKRAFLAAGTTAEFLQRKKRATPPVEPKITGELEARIIALACGKAPKGCARWTLQLLADKCVELQYVDTLSAMSVCRVLKKRSLSPI
jgi:transposase